MLLQYSGCSGLSITVSSECLFLWVSGEGTDQLLPTLGERDSLPTGTGKEAVKATMQFLLSVPLNKGY
jgi:hypothetical protein